MPKNRQNNWISPRNSTNNASALKSSAQLLSNVGAGSVRDDFTAVPSESQLSEDIRSVKLDLPNQNVIKADTDRARFITKDHHDAMQVMLTYFCKTENISYKQGMNDVMAPFIHLAIQRSQRQAATQMQSTGSHQKKKRPNSKKQQKNGGNQNAANANSSGNASFNNEDRPVMIDLEEPYIMMRQFINTF